MTLREILARVLLVTRITVAEVASGAAPVRVEVHRHPRAAECPLSDCTTCRPDPQPFDAGAEIQRAIDGEINAVTWWMIQEWPDAWYREDPEKVRRVAARLVDLRIRVEDGMVAR